MNVADLNALSSFLPVNLWVRYRIKTGIKYLFAITSPNVNFEASSISPDPNLMKLAS